MEAQTDVLVQGNSESGGPTTGEPSFVAPLLPDANLPAGPTPNEVIETLAGDSVQEPGSAEAPRAEEPGKPPAGYEGVPPELWPGPDGKPPVLTEALMKKLRGKYFTVRHPRLANCGHKFDTINEPRTNCENCWFQWFNSHPGLVEVTDQFRRTQGRGPLIGMRGIKYVKMFERYMATVIALMKLEKQIRDSQEGRNASSEAPGSDTDANQVAPADQSGSGTSNGSSNQGIGEDVRGNQDSETRQEDRAAGGKSPDQPADVR